MNNIYQHYIQANEVAGKIYLDYKYNTTYFTIDMYSIPGVG